MTPKQVESQARLILANREIDSTLKTLRQAGSDAVYRSADVCDADATKRVVAEARSRWGKIDMLIHGAGIVADKRISEKSPEQFQQVFATKVLGLRSLLDATQGDPLSFICLFSSVAGRYGNPGQADYAMANSAMNRIAREEAVRRPQCVIRSLNWGPWDGGMVTPGLRDHFAAKGIPIMPLQEGAAAFVREVQHRSIDPADVDVVLTARPNRSDPH
jgi:NAD(P)-dependent dehydrogenase (short-subunit alcohol dehydrogenase family)